MTGQVHWVPFVILFVAVSPVVALWIAGRLRDRAYRRDLGSVRCRSHGNKLVDCTVIRDAQSGDPIGIQSCTQFRNPEDVRCDRECLPLFSRVASLWKQSRAP